MGYTPEYIKDGGVGFALEIYEQDHLRIFNDEIFPDRIKLLKSISPDLHSNFIFSHNLQLKNKSGEIVNLVQRSCFIKSDNKGNHIMSFGTINNIGHFGDYMRVSQIVEKISGNGASEKSETIFKKNYFLHSEDKIFTKREKEMLLWTAEGLTSKEIANKLFVSENTVINHRRNMHEKTNTKNVAELIAFSIRLGIV